MSETPTTEQLLHEIKALSDLFEEKLKVLDMKLLGHFLVDDQRFTANEEVIAKAETSLSHRLETMNEFRQQILTERVEFARKEELGAMDDKFDARVAAIEDAHANSRGIRNGLTIAAAVVVTLFGVAFGAIEKSQLSNNDVANIVQRESPWATDKPALEQDIQQVQSQIQSLQVRLNANEQLIHFLCRSQQAQTAAC